VWHDSWSLLARQAGDSKYFLPGSAKSVAGRSEELPPRRTDERIGSTNSARFRGGYVGGTRFHEVRLLERSESKTVSSRQKPSAPLELGLERSSDRPSVSRLSARVDMLYGILEMQKELLLRLKRF
jgi:hypothetical protein